MSDSAKKLALLSKAKIEKRRKILNRFKFIDYEKANTTIFNEADFYLFKAIELDKEISKGPHLTDEDAEMLMKSYNFALYLHAYPEAENKYNEKREHYIKKYLNIRDCEDYFQYLDLIQMYPKFLHSNIPFEVLLTNAHIYNSWLNDSESNSLPFENLLSTAYWSDEDYVLPF